MDKIDESTYDVPEEALRISSRELIELLGEGHEEDMEEGWAARATEEKDGMETVSRGLKEPKTKRRTFTISCGHLKIAGA